MTEERINWVVIGSSSDEENGGVTARAGNNPRPRARQEPPAPPANNLPIAQPEEVVLLDSSADASVEILETSQESGLSQESAPAEAQESSSSGDGPQSESSSDDSSSLQSLSDDDQPSPGRKLPVFRTARRCENKPIAGWIGCRDPSPQKEKQPPITMESAKKPQNEPNSSAAPKSKATAKKKKERRRWDKPDFLFESSTEEEEPEREAVADFDPMGWSSSDSDTSSSLDESSDDCVIIAADPAIGAAPPQHATLVTGEASTSDCQIIFATPTADEARAAKKEAALHRFDELKKHLPPTLTEPAQPDIDAIYWDHCPIRHNKTSWLIKELHNRSAEEFGALIYGLTQESPKHLESAFLGGVPTPLHVAICQRKIEYLKAMFELARDIEMVRELLYYAFMMPPHRMTGLKMNPFLLVANNSAMWRDLTARGRFQKRDTQPVDCEILKLLTTFCERLRRDVSILPWIEPQAKGSFFPFWRPNPPRDAPECPLAVAAGNGDFELFEQFLTYPNHRYAFDDNQQGAIQLLQLEYVLLCALSTGSVEIFDRISKGVERLLPAIVPAGFSGIGTFKLAKRKTYVGIDSLMTAVARFGDKKLAATVEQFIRKANDFGWNIPRDSPISDETYEQACVRHKTAHLLLPSAPIVWQSQQHDYMAEAVAAGYIDVFLYIPELELGIVKSDALVHAVENGNPLLLKTLLHAVHNAPVRPEVKKQKLIDALVRAILIRDGEIAQQLREDSLLDWDCFETIVSGENKMTVCQWAQWLTDDLEKKEKSVPEWLNFKKPGVAVPEA